MEFKPLTKCRDKTKNIKQLIITVILLFKFFFTYIIRVN